MKKIALFALVMAVAVAGLTFAQAKPDFSGKWAPKEAAAPAAGARGGMGGPMTVKQTATDLTQEVVRGENTMTTVYKLDGTESKNSMMGRGGQQMESTSTAKWDGSALVITTKMDMGNGPVETTQKWTLAGSALTVESTNARGTQKRVYKKTT